MEIGLLSVIKDEQNNLSDLLGDIYDLFSEISVVDTGSTDDSVTMLKELYDITPTPYEPPRDRKFDITSARNNAISSMKSDWILTLDADERIGREAVSFLRSYRPSKKVDGFGFKWMDYRFGDVFEDYKLFLFRNNRNISFTGKIHDVPQTAIRGNGQRADFLPFISVEHHPNTLRTAHRDAYLEQLFWGIDENPTWYRYHWFLGLTYYAKHNDVALGARYLTDAAFSYSREFPVEVMNATMLLSKIFADNREVRWLKKILERSIEFCSEVSNDFEVSMNCRLLPWLIDSLEKARRGELEKITPYQFAF